MAIGHWFSAAFRAGHKFEMALARTLKIDSYELRDSCLVKHRGLFRTESVRLEDIARWRVEHEMVFDIVCIERNDSTTVTWLDVYDDLNGILERAVPDRRSIDP